MPNMDTFHADYQVRCLKTYLPDLYTSNDSNRMTLAFFTIAALDLLDALDSAISEEERKGYIDWVYNCQLETGGFRGFPGASFGEKSNEENAVWDPANVAATYFALLILVLLKDDLSRVKRRECLQWLRTVQRPDGSFGETVSDNGEVEGGYDSRFGYCATCVRWVLRGTAEGEVDGVPDTDVEKLVKCIRLAQVGALCPAN